MIIIGVDPHKRVHTASAVDAGDEPAARVVARSRRRWPAIGGCCGGRGGSSERRWAVENARGLGRHLAQWLVARGERRR